MPLSAYPREPTRVISLYGGHSMDVALFLLYRRRKTFSKTSLEDRPNELRGKNVSLCVFFFQ